MNEFIEELKNQIKILAQINHNQSELIKSLILSDDMQDVVKEDKNRPPITLEELQSDGVDFTWWLNEWSYDKKKNEYIMNFRFPPNMNHIQEVIVTPDEIKEILDKQIIERQRHWSQIVYLQSQRKQNNPEVYSTDE